MIEGGEDVKFIARRMPILSSEDTGNAKSWLPLSCTTTLFKLWQRLLSRENYFESSCSVFATLPKSNASHLAIGTAQQLVKQTGDLPVPAK
jgi:putative ATPase